MNPDRGVARAAFLVAMAMLGVAVGLVLVRHAAPPPANPSGPRHHYLDSPYGQLPFLRGQPMAQTNAAQGRSFAKDYSHQYVLRGDAWLAITDVNTATPATRFQIPGLTALPADEADYPFADFVAFNVDHHEDVGSAQRAVDWINRAAGVPYLARPLVGPQLPEAQIAGLKGLAGIQIFDARLVRYQPAQADASQLWDQLLTDGHHLWGLVADDSQDAFGPDSTLGQTSVDVQAPPNPTLIADALKRGAFVDSMGEHILGVAVADDTITVTTEDATMITFIGDGGEVLSQVSSPRASYRVKWTETYVRAVATRGDSAKAWSQPVFVVP